MCWCPDIGEWKLIVDGMNDDMDLFFQYDVEGKLMDMPYILFVFVTEDTTISLI